MGISHEMYEEFIPLMIVLHKRFYKKNHNPELHNTSQTFNNTDAG